LTDITPKLIELLKEAQSDSTTAQCSVCKRELRPQHTSITSSFKSFFLSCSVTQIISLLENPNTRPASRLPRNKDLIPHAIVIERDLKQPTIVNNITWETTKLKKPQGVADDSDNDDIGNNDEVFVIICNDCGRPPSKRFAFGNNFAPNAEHVLIKTPHVLNASMRIYGEALLQTQQQHQPAVQSILSQVPQNDTAETSFDYKVQHEHWHDSASDMVVTDADMTAVPKVFKKIAHDGSP
jgi:hypothetical protein